MPAPRCTRPPVRADTTASTPAMRTSTWAIYEDGKGGSAEALGVVERRDKDTREAGMVEGQELPNPLPKSPPSPTSQLPPTRPQPSLNA